MYLYIFTPVVIAEYLNLLPVVSSRSMIPDQWLVEGKVMGEARSGPEAGRLTPCTPGATAETHHHFDSDDEGGSSSSGSSNPAQLAQLEVHPNTTRRTASSALLLAAQITVTHLTVALPGRALHVDDVP